MPNRRTSLVKSNSEFSKNTSDIYKENANKRNFDDWIWGKHSVFEALINERAINRIWCTQKYFLQRNFIFCSRDSNQKVFSLKKFLGIGYLN